MKVTSIVYRDLAEALHLRREVIADHALRDKDPIAHLKALQRVSERILALQAALPAPVDPRLAHYLERCSYDKALALLKEHSIEKTALAPRVNQFTENKKVPGS
jgi:hypothetical protein